MELAFANPTTLKTLKNNVSSAQLQDVSTVKPKTCAPPVTLPKASTRPLPMVSANVSLPNTLIRSQTPVKTVPNHYLAANYAATEPHVKPVTVH